MNSRVDTHPEASQIEAEAEEGHRAFGQERKLQCGEGERRPAAGSVNSLRYRVTASQARTSTRRCATPDDAPHERDASELLRAERPGGDQRAQEPGHQDGSVREEQPSRVAQELA